MILFTYGIHILHKKGGVYMNKVEYYRKKSNITRMELADKIGISRQYVRLIEQQKATVGIDKAIKISKLFNVPVEQIFLP